MGRLHRAFGSLAVALGISMSLVACTATTPTPGAGSTAPAPASTAASTPAAPVTLKVWGWNVAVPEETFKAFEAENPTIKVDFKSYAFADYTQALRPALTSADGPDVFEVQPGANVQNFGPLGVDLGPLAEKALGKDWKGQYVAAGLEQLTVGGKQMGLPYQMSAAGLIYYNKSILDDAGVTSIPKDFDAWKQACAKITAKGKQCLIHGAKDSWVNLDLYIATANSDNPGLIYDAIAGKVKWTDPRLVQSAANVQSLFTGGIAAAGAPGRAQYMDSFNDFVSGKAGFIFLGTWNTAGTQTKTGLAGSEKGLSGKASGPFFSAPFPASKAGQSPTKLFGGPDNGWSISAQSKKQEAAWKLVQFLTNGGGQKVAAGVSILPANPKVAISTADVVVPEQAANIKEQQAQASDLVGARQIPYADLEAALGRALSEIIAGKDPAAAMAPVEAASSAVKR